MVVVCQREDCKYCIKGECMNIEIELDSNGKCESFVHTIEDYASTLTQEDYSELKYELTRHDI
jgi:hypothetical protein